MNINKFSYSFDELEISPKEVYRTMKMEDEPPEPIPELLQQIWEQLPQITAINGGYRIIENPIFNRSNFSVTVDQQQFFLGKTVFLMLQKASAVALFACSAGEGISQLSKQLMDAGDLMEGYIADTAGSVIVERAMDRVQEQLKTDMARHGTQISNRYSPGYCDWNVQEQHQLFSFLPSNFCGISLTESALMEPVKSVSGMIGIGEKIKYNDYTCEICTSVNCHMRKV
ncbi:MAG: hypothetical protein N4A71_26480 [Carboxylicivirga sp.]|jgi:hypothetical protein|nr:hypothetical protein [Carboxylicivirga sp.]